MIILFLGNICEFIFQERVFFSMGTNANLSTPVPVPWVRLMVADEGSINILKDISNRISEYPVLIICSTFRDNEVNDEHITRYYLYIGGIEEALELAVESRKAAAGKEIFLECIGCKSKENGRNKATLFDRA